MCLAPFERGIPTQPQTKIQSLGFGPFLASLSPYGDGAITPTSST